jgi:antitoxin component of MazEF toxin-antitoxin module
MADTTVTFETTLTATGNNAGIVVPPEALEQLGAGKRPAVVVDVNGYGFECTIGSMGGKAMIAFSAARRKETGLAGGDPITVTLSLAEGPRAVEVPADLRKALGANPGTEAFFGGLSNSLQRYHVDNIEGAKTAETRQRRIDKAIGLFLAGKAR